MEVRNECGADGLVAGIVIARQIKVGTSPEPLARKLTDLVRERSLQDFPPGELKNSVRSLLRKGGFKPTGRNKPASEYLAQAAREGRFPFINNLVDVNNYISLLSGLPVSLLDSAVVGEHAILRKGKPGESYVFNQAGQMIDLEGLVCLCSGNGEPMGNPVKDSMAAKIGDSTSQVIGVIYSPLQAGESIEKITSLFADMLCEYGDTRDAEARVV